MSDESGDAANFRALSVNDHPRSLRNQPSQE
jgi:hypothetical protein